MVNWHIQDKKREESDDLGHSSWNNQLPKVSQPGEGRTRGHGWTEQFLLRAGSTQAAGGVITLFLSVAQPPAAVFAAAEPRGWSET